MTFALWAGHTRVFAVAAGDCQRQELTGDFLWECTCAILLSSPNTYARLFSTRHTLVYLPLAIARFNGLYHGIPLAMVNPLPFPLKVLTSLLVCIHWFELARSTVPM